MPGEHSELGDGMEVKMKVIVDKMPKDTMDCPFAYWDDEYRDHLCSLSACLICNLKFGLPCNRLKSLEEEEKND